VAADWEFGSGVQAVTPVSRAEEGFYREHGLSYYRKFGRFDLTPGHSNSLGELYRVFDAGAAILRCFQCHSTGPLNVTDDGVIQPREPGVQCEACHGAGAEHVRLGGLKAAIMNPVRLTPVAVNDHCGACHRKPAAEGSDTDYSNPWNARHQPLYLARSACFKQSGTLSCLTCHAAHQRAVQPMCGGCHAKPQHRVAISGACADCHMPKVTPRDGLSFTNHWIAVYRRGGDPLRPLAAKAR
jgi:hypothetical protein